MKTFDELPKWVQEIMLQRQFEHTGKRDPELFKHNVRREKEFGGFDWTSTPERFNVWSDVIEKGNYKPLADFHKINPKTGKLIPQPKTMKTHKTSYQYKVEKIAGLEAMLDQQLKQHLREEKKLSEQIRVLQAKIDLYEQIEKQKVSKVHGEYERTVICDDLEPKKDCSTCKHWDISENKEPCISCDILKSKNWEPQEQPKPVDPYQVFRDAIKAGKTVQMWDNSKWVDPTDCKNQNWTFMFPPSDYRIKPDPIPFDFSDAEHLIGKAIVNKGNGAYYLITGIRKENIFISNFPFLYEELLKYYTFEDGSPCGKEPK